MLHNKRITLKLLEYNGSKLDILKKHKRAKDNLKGFCKIVVHCVKHGAEEYCTVQQACNILVDSLQLQSSFLQTIEHKNSDGTSYPQSQIEARENCAETKYN